MRDLRWAVAGLLVTGATLTGCSEPQAANTTLPPTSAAETTEALPELGPADFPVPDEARTKDAAGAEAFLYYWIELLNRQQAIPAGEPLRDFGPECRECLRIARIYDEAAKVGNRYVGGELTVLDAAAAPVEGDQVSVTFIASEEAVQLVDPSGTPIETVEAAPKLSSGVTLTWSDEVESWLIASMTLG
ncbi:DUF6318 family protein [Blastococcus sp. PRF04-17]|uniref:DUF6318 family protein n=1 Tax=Blastococcus sp. PRF04-17 TaxID=2933797 RepID=UPI001FF3E268|nr:DUF6318 family protein [Blastococcus sp. PRF04-17]UOY01836.1 hypothetical protein MVA48_00145 [Blastococcus sp. PRF04-17]